MEVELRIKYGSRVHSNEGKVQLSDVFFLDNSSTAIKCQHSATKVNLLVRCLYCPVLWDFWFTVSFFKVGWYIRYSFPFHTNEIACLLVTEGTQKKPSINQTARQWSDGDFKRPNIQNVSVYCDGENDLETTELTLTHHFTISRI